MDHESANPLCLLADYSGGRSIHCAGSRLVFLGLVDRGVGGGIDDHVGAKVANGGADGVRIGKITLHAG